MIDDDFDSLVKQAACRGLLDSTYRIDSTHVTAIQYNDEATWNYDSTAEEHYYGFGCVIMSARPKIPIVAEFTQRKQIDAETAIHVTKDAFAVGTPIGMLGDSAYDILEWHDLLLTQGAVPIAPYNSRNTDDRLTSKTVSTNTLKTSASSSQLWPKRMITGRKWNVQMKLVRTATSGTAMPEAASTHEHRCSLQHLCLRVIVAITNYERGHSPRQTNLKNL